MILLGLPYQRCTCPFEHPENNQGAYYEPVHMQLEVANLLAFSSC